VISPTGQVPSRKRERPVSCGAACAEAGLRGEFRRAVLLFGLHERYAVCFSQCGRYRRARGRHRRWRCCNTSRKRIKARRSSRHRRKTRRWRDDKGAMRMDATTRWGIFSAYYFADDYRLDNPYPTGQGGANVPGFNAISRRKSATPEPGLH